MIKYMFEGLITIVRMKASHKILASDILLRCSQIKSFRSTLLSYSADKLLRIFNTSVRQDDENDEFDNDDDEDVENELLFDENIDSSDESSLNDDLSLYLNQKNGSLMRKSFKLRK